MHYILSFKLEASILSKKKLEASMMYSFSTYYKENTFKFSLHLKLDK